MGEPNRTAGNFADYLQTVVKLDALQYVTQGLDKELENSQRVMDSIKAMYSSIPNFATEPMPANGTQNDNLSKLDVDLPNLLLPDMVENTADVDIDDIIDSMKSYAENLKKNIVAIETQPRPKEFVPIDIGKYAESMDQLSKRLANIKLNKKDDAANRSPELEAKLAQLCEDVDMFNKMVQAKTTISESNQNWVETRPDTSALKYDGIVSKLLAGINEVTYLLKNKQ